MIHPERTEEIRQKIREISQEEVTFTVMDCIRKWWAQQQSADWEEQLAELAKAGELEIVNEIAKDPVYKAIEKGDNRNDTKI